MEFRRTIISKRSSGKFKVRNNCSILTSLDRRKESSIRISSNSNSFIKSSSISMKRFKPGSRLENMKKSSKNISLASSQLKKLSQPRVSNMVTAVEQTSDVYKQHLFQTCQALKIIKRIRQPRPQEIEAKTVFLPRRKGYENKKTVVFDMDETLIHCLEDPSEAQTPLTVTFPTGESFQVGINIRPFAREILKSANKNFEVIVFTASLKSYADRVLDILDPSNELIHHRLYRDSCLVIDGLYIKDLRILKDRKLAEVVIVDNATHSFAYQLFNGIPILSWYDDTEDRELLKLTDYLNFLAGFPDMRDVNKQTFRLHSFQEEFNQ